MKKIALFAFAALLLGSASCKTQTCPAYSKQVTTKPAPRA